jgi:hypothetical protein
MGSNRHSKVNPPNGTRTTLPQTQGLNPAKMVTMVRESADLMDIWDFLRRLRYYVLYKNLLP